MKKYYLINSLALLVFFITLACSEDTIESTGEGVLTGTVVTDNTNEPLANVKISTNPASSTVFSDESGAFIITPIQTDDYSVQAELDGYVTSFEAVTINVGETSNVVFELITSQANNKAPEVSTLLSPTDGQENLSTEVDFLWSSGKNDNDIVTYTLELRNGNSNAVETFEIIDDTTYTASNLSLGTNYFWQITSSDDINPEVKSAVSQFRTVDVPDNRFLFTRNINGNAVIFSGNDDDADTDDEEDQVNFNELQLTSESFNSFRPKRNTQVNKIAFLRTTGEGTHLYTMDLDGTDVERVTSNIPVNGFRLDEITFAWAENGSRLYYPNFDKLYSIDPDGGGASLIYQTPDGSFISEISTSDLNTNIIAVKTNDFEGYNARIYTVNLSTGFEEDVVLEAVNGAVSGISLSANVDSILYSYDTSGSQNSQYRRFSSRVFVANLSTMVIQQVATDVETGENDLFPVWSPTEGEIIYTRVGNNIGATPEVYITDLGNNANLIDDLLFTNAYQPDWQ